MKGFGVSTFGELNAAGYDEEHDPGTTDEAVELLWELAAGGKTLELAIGTGRIALPLYRRGLEIQGIDGSPDMVAELRKKPDGKDIPVEIGDMADVAVAGSFDLVYLVFNTLFNLPSQEAQIRCFDNAAKHLNPGGTFLIETIVPDLSQFQDGQSVRTRSVDIDSAEIEAAIHDPVEQTVDYQRIRLTGKGVRMKALPIRYAWPAEIDLMARLAGMRLENRWGSWTRAPFTATCPMHVSVYRKVA